MFSVNTLGRDHNGWFISWRGVVCDICDIWLLGRCNDTVLECENIKNWGIMEESSYCGEQIRGEKGWIGLAPEWRIGIRFLLLVSDRFKRQQTTLLCEPFCESLQVPYDLALFLTNKSSRMDITWPILSRVCKIFRISGKAFGLLRLEAIGHSRRQRFKRYITMTWWRRNGHLTAPIPYLAVLLVCLVFLSHHPPTTTKSHSNNIGWIKLGHGNWCYAHTVQQLLLTFQRSKPTRLRHHPLQHTRFRSNGEALGYVSFYC